MYLLNILNAFFNLFPAHVRINSKNRNKGDTRVLNHFLDNPKIIADLKNLWALLLDAYF